MQSILPLLVLAFPPVNPAARVPGLELSEPVSYHVTMTTTFVVPQDHTQIELLRVYQALPTVRSWTHTGTALGATGISHTPPFGKRIREDPDADSMFWEIKAPRAAIFEQLTTGTRIPMRGAAGMNLYAPDGRTSELQKIRADYTNVHTWSEVYFPGAGWIEVDPGNAEAPFRLGHHLILNHRRFQNYVVWLIEAGTEKFATWTFRDGAYVSDYGVENIISYVEKPLAK